MSTYYLMHHGVEGQEWGKRNGPPYPLNSESKADLRAQKKEAKAQKKKNRNIAIGTERLNNRIDEANRRAQTDKYATKVGWNSTKKAGDAQKKSKDIKQISNEILENEDRLAKLGQGTHNRRVADVIGTSAASTGAAFVAALALDSPVGVIAAAPIIAAGVAYYKASKR